MVKERADKRSCHIYDSSCLPEADATVCIKPDGICDPDDK